MSEDQELKIPPELDYIMQACRAVSTDRLHDALWLMKEGLRESSGIAEQIDTSLFIALLRALVVDLETRSEEYFGPLTRRDSFAGRELRPHSQPISKTDLHEGAVYFAVNYVDDDMRIPIVETLVFIGKNLEPADVGKAYFQDVESYREGVPYDWSNGSATAGDSHNSNAIEADSDNGSATFFCGSEDELNHIFKYEDALDELYKCSIRRKEAGV